MATLTANRPALAPAPKAASQDATRLERTVGEHYDFVWRSLRRLGVQQADAEDVAQEVFVTLSRRLNDVEAGKERAFLYRTAIHHAAHVHRSRARRREVPDEQLDEAPSSARTPEDLLDGARARALCHELLDELSLEQRAVFVLFELEQMTMVDVAETLELPLGTVASRLRRGREAFKHRLERRLASQGGER